MTKENTWLETITSTDGATVEGRCFAPQGPACGPTVLILPAMGVRADYYDPLAQALAAQGSGVLSVDIRGQGSSSEKAARGARFGFWEAIHLDLPAAEAAARRLWPSRPLLVLAHSLGGQLATLAIGQGSLKPEALVLAAAGTAHWRDWPLVKRPGAALLVHAVAAAGRLLPWYPGPRLGFGGEHPKTFMRDWSRIALRGEYACTRQGRSLEPDRFCALPVLCLAIEGDLIAPRQAAARLVDRLSSPKTTIQSIAPDPGKGSWSRHFSWVRRPDRIVASVLDWFLTTQVASRIHEFGLARAS